MKRWWGWLAVLGLAAPAAAQQAPRPVTLDEAVAMARRNAPGVVQAQGQQRTAAAGVRSAWGSFLPSVSLSAGATRQLPAGSRTRIENGQVVTLPEEPWSLSGSLGANLELFDGGRRFFDLRQARARTQSAEASLAEREYAAALDAKQEYFNVLAARESRVAAAAQLEQAEQQHRTAVARTRAREATRSDSLRSAIQLHNARLAVLQADTDLESANAGLARAIGSVEPVTATAGDSLEHSALAVGDDELRGLVENGPAVEQAVAGLDAARAAANAAWTDYLPSVSLGYSRGASGASPDFAVPDDPVYSGSMRLSLSLPIFNQFQREAQGVQARVERDNAEASLRDARLAARASLVQWLGSLRTAGERVRALTATIEAATEDLRLQQRRYAVGSSTVLDVLTSQTQLDQARRDLIRARFDQRIAKARIEALAGRDL